MGNFLNLANSNSNVSQIPAPNQVYNQGYMSSLRNMMNIVQSSGNPGQMLQTIMSQNPKIKEVMGLVQSNGGDWQKTFLQLARERGVNPNDVLNQLKQ